MRGDEDPDFYGERWASVYDELHAAMDPTAAADTLARLGGDGRVLELGVGTGRLALPLAERGVAVHGIDASEAMVARLRDKPGGTSIPVTVGDFALVPVPGEYSLIYVVFNTFFALLDQDRQVECFRNVAERLAPGGAFVLECFVPDLSRFGRAGQAVQARGVEADRADLEVSRHEPVSQRVNSQLVTICETGVVLRPVVLRYAWPAELDLMARLAGLHLRDRWAGWSGEPFSADSRMHVSVYRAA